MENRLDTAESVFFQRELESIDRQLYEAVYPQYIARSFLPTQDGVDESDNVYTYRMFDRVGKAKWVRDHAKDFPAAGVFGGEKSQTIQMLGASFGYSINDIKAAAKVGRSLDAMLGMAARNNIEEQIDSVLALGDADEGMVGLLGLSSTTTFTPSTKAAGGTTWGTLSAPNATGTEVANDIIGLASKIVSTTEGVFSRFRIVLPIELYNYAAAQRISTVSSTTALAFALSSPFVESVTPWFRCSGVGSTGTGGGDTRMAAFPYDPRVMTALVPQEFRAEAPQLEGMAYNVPCSAKCGGVVCRYPMAVGYADGI